MTEIQKQIADLEAQIKALQGGKVAKVAKAKGEKIARAPRASVKLLTPKVRQAKQDAIAEQYRKKLAQISNPMNTLSPSEVVDAHLGGLADLV